MPQDNVLNTLSENLAIILSRADACEEQRRITLSMLVSHLCGISEQKDTDAAAEIYHRICAMGQLRCEDKAFICKSISCEPHFSYKLTDTLLDTIEDTPESARGRIAYVKNKQNDDVFLAFSKRIRGARAFYAGTFSDCCEAVFDAKSEYCLLPIEDGEIGKLYSFYSLIDKYELKICHVQRLAKDDSQGVLYALCGKSVSPFEIASGKLRLEFTVVREKDEYIGDIITAISALSADVYSLGTQPVEYDHLKQKCIFSVDVRSDTLVPLLLYLELEYPRFTSIGLYKTEKENPTV